MKKQKEKIPRFLLMHYGICLGKIVTMWRQQARIMSMSKFKAQDRGGLQHTFQTIPLTASKPLKLSLNSSSKRPMKRNL